MKSTKTHIRALIVILLTLLMFNTTAQDIMSGLTPGNVEGKFLPESNPSTYKAPEFDKPDFDKKSNMEEDPYKNLKELGKEGKSYPERTAPSRSKNKKSSTYTESSTQNAVGDYKSFILVLLGVVIIGSMFLYKRMQVTNPEVGSKRNELRALSTELALKEKEIGLREKEKELKKREDNLRDTISN